LNGSNRTIVESRQEYEDANGLDGDVIFIQNLDTSQILDTQSSNASYDLRVGNEYRDHRDSGKIELPDGDKICLQPGSAVIIETIESVQFPKSRFGHIVPKVSLLQNGLSNTASKIDPWTPFITVLIWVKEQFISKTKILHTLCASYPRGSYSSSERISKNRWKL